MKTIWIILIIIGCLVVIGAISAPYLIMKWGRSYVEETAKYAEERSDIQILCTRDLYLIFNDNMPDYLCYNGNSVQFTLENAGTIDIRGLEVTLIGEKDTKIIELINPSIKIEPLIGIGYVYRGEVSYNRDEIGAIQEIKITPSIKPIGTANAVKCAASPLRSTSIEMCVG